MSNFKHQGKVIVSNVVKYSMPKAPGIDAISVLTEDFSPRSGKIIIETFGSVWSASWGGMSETHGGVLGFVLSCDNAYLVDKLLPCERNYEVDIDGAIENIKKAITEGRRSGEISEWEAISSMEMLVNVDSVDGLVRWTSDVEYGIGITFDNFYDLVPKKLTAEAYKLNHYILPRIKEMLYQFVPEKSGVK